MAALFAILGLITIIVSIWAFFRPIPKLRLRTKKEALIGLVIGLALTSAANISYQGTPRAGQTEVAPETVQQEEESSPSGETEAASSDDALLAGTIEAAEELVFPPYDASVTYDPTSKVVTVRFTTPASYKIDYANFWLRWRDNQWTVLQQFKEASIPVDKVVVITNYHDQAASEVRAETSAESIDRYARSTSDELWLRTTTMHQRVKGEVEWSKIE